MDVMSDFYGNGQAPQAYAPARREYFTKRQTLLVAAGTVTAALLGVGCVFAVQDVVTAHTPTTVQYSGTGLGQGSGLSGGASGYGGFGSSGFGSSGQSGSGSGSGSSSGSGSGSSSGGQSGTSASTTAATASESRGIVLIDTQLSYQDAEAAGTGMVLTSNGEVLTNNHVIEGATSIQVKVVATGQSYTATVVGDDPTDDVAVLQLQGAHGLTTAATDSSHSVSSGDSVTGVGNAEGGGTLVAAPGQVTGLDQSITTEAEGSDASESLHGLIETNAAIEPGDSGGPLFDSAGKIVGMDTAASSGGTSNDGYAIPISTALSIAKQIESGTAGGNVEIGYPAFLGIELSTSESSDSSGLGSDGSGSGFGSGSAGSGSDGSGSGFGSSFGSGSGLGSDGSASSGASVSGAAVAGVISGGPAAGAGLTAGDVITAIDGTSIASSSELQSAMAQYRPGDKVSVTWTDASGQSHTASITLSQGPAA